MNTFFDIDMPAKWKLSKTSRMVRAVIGAVTILSALLIPGLNEGWLFTLSMIGLYTSQTAILNTDLVYAFFTPGGTDSQVVENEPQTDEQHAEEVQFEFKKAA